MITKDERDILNIMQILKYCNIISSFLNRFDNDYDQFIKDDMLQYSVCMAISQIGETAKRLSEDFTDAHKEIPWQQVRHLRNMIVHEYHNIEFDVIWGIVSNDIPVLRKFCEEIIKSEE